MSRGGVTGQVWGAAKFVKLLPLLIAVALLAGVPSAVSGQTPGEPFTRNTAEDFTELSINGRPAGIWSDETTMWVVDDRDNKIYAYNMITKERDAAKDFNDLGINEHGIPSGIWSDGMTLWMADWWDEKIFAYNLVTKQRDADKDFNTLEGAGHDWPEGICAYQTTMWVVETVEEKLFAYNLETKARDTDMDFDTLAAAGNEDSSGIWCDGSTMWVADWDDEKIYAYDMTTKGRDSDKDFNALSAAGNESPQGIWSDGTTMWVADLSDSKIYAYNLATKARDQAKEFDTLDPIGNGTAKGIWSDDTTMWVADQVDDKLYGYNLDTKQRDPSKDFDTLAADGNDFPEGIWSDGITMWVADRPDHKIYAYSMASKQRDPANDFDTLETAGNVNLRGIWSDAITMWVANWSDSKLYAYNLATKERDSAKDFDTLDTAGNDGPTGIWSDGTTMWVSDWDDNKVYAYNMATKQRESSKDFNTLSPAGQDRPTYLWSDGTTMWVVEDYDELIYAYNMPIAQRELAECPAGLFRITANRVVPEQAEQEVQSEFGGEWRRADWNDLVAAWGTFFEEELKTLFEVGQLHVTLNGNAQWGTSGRWYFVEDHDGTLPTNYTFLVHEQLGGNEISLGSWVNQDGPGWRVLAVHNDFPQMVADNAVYLKGGSLNGQRLGCRGPSVSVSPGQTISGSISLLVANEHVPSAIFPVGWTPSWGDHSTSYRSIVGSAPAETATRYSAPISLVAPSTPGTYSIWFAAGAETSLPHVMSCTHWASGPLGNQANAPPIWNDGNDIAEWATTQTRCDSEVTPNGVGLRIAVVVRSETTTTSPVTDPPDPPKPDKIKIEKCVTEVNGNGKSDTDENAEEAAGSITLGDTITGKWEAGCPSITRGARLAKYYTLTVPIISGVKIALDSHLDTYLVLRSGGLSGNIIAEDDDDGEGNNSLIEQTLPAGEYTIEATTFYSDGVEAEFTLTVTSVPMVLYDGPVSAVAHRGYAPAGPTMTVRLLPTLPRGRLEITIEDADGFGAGAGPLGGAQTTDGSAGTVLIALPRSVWLVYDELSVEVRESGSWSTHSQSDEEALLAEEATGGDFSSTLEQVPGLIENAEDASGLIASLNTLMSAASVPAATPDSSALDDIFTESHANCVSQVVVPWLTEATETTGVRVSLPVENLAGSYLSVAASFVAGGGEQGLAQLHDLLDTGEVVPSCQRPEQSEE